MTYSETLRVGVLFGGRSGEHEVSLNSAKNVMNALQEAGHTVVPIGITAEGRWLAADDPMQQLVDHAGGAVTEGDIEKSSNYDWALLPSGGEDQQMPAIDVLFPVLHGPYGEDGTIQGLLEMANLPYVGCGVLSSAVGMDKAIAKKLFAQEGLHQTPHRVLMRQAWQRAPEEALDEIMANLQGPYFIKPANLGSSVGVSRATDRATLAAALNLAARYDRKLIIEAAVPNAREIEVSVLGNDEPIASVPGEIVPGSEFYDYEDKYLNDNSQLHIPARLDEAATKQIQAMAIQAFQAIDGSGLARVDFLLDDATGILYLNEVNTMPGFTRISMYPKLWSSSGVSYPALVDRLLQLALERYEDRQQNSTTRLGN